MDREKFPVPMVCENEVRNGTDECLVLGMGRRKAFTLLLHHLLLVIKPAVHQEQAEGKKQD